MSSDKPKGFFARDEDFGTRLDEAFSQGEQFLALAVERDTPFTNPKTGETIKTRTKITARKLDPETMRPFGLPVVVKTLGQVIYEHAGQVRADDFPAVVYWDRVAVERYNTEAMVLRKVAGWPLSDEMRSYLGLEPDAA
jgi:hypothetical protein